MGKIETIIDESKDLTIQTVTGDITSSEIIQKITEYYMGKSTNFILWDFSKANVVNIKSDEIQKIVELTKKYSHFRKEGKTAMVFSSQLGFALGRIYDILHDIGKSEIRHMAFQDIESAARWLGVEL